ncbi:MULTISPECIES: cell envelope integrity protein TolA [unclassified Janthinobacterium]|uniref:cell envelope integrity protein TolA n=1 Tax=unclassified Janthinobacterium TaxID=2610881 RepID=UPI002587E179|nr:MULTISPECIES: cell envelope integrity protein TolA [unclassified Janthinobacterium]MCX7294865.1 cell envelope integrity protein TolA [Janthinobacterium sp.]MED5597260.1 cell envelope integrity protein TolA [Janthinobacterium sp. P210006]
MQTKQIDHVLGKPYSVPRERSRWPSLGLALAMHLGLLFFLWVGVHWQNTEPVAVEAEVWDMQVQTAAPPPEVATAPEPTPTPPPEPQVEQPAPPPPPPVAAPEPKVDLREAEIALERKKAKLKEEKDKAAAEERRKQELKEREEEKRELEKQKQKEKDKAEKLEKEKADKLEKAKLAKEKEKAAEEKAEKELSDKKAAAEKAAKAKKAAEEKKAADKARDAEMSRITGAAGAGTTGTAAKATAPRKDSGYVAALTSKIKSNIAYSGSTDVPGNPRAVFKIEQLPTGEIISVRKIKSSGLPAYDSSVENAINKSSPLPKKKDGTVEREIELIFEMKDLPK